MTKYKYPIEYFDKIETPFYYYDMEVLDETLRIVEEETSRYGYCQHYAVKANSNPRILEFIAAKGFGADCVSGNEVRAAIEAGFSKSRIVFAGVGKTDKEIEYAIDNDIFCFNVESSSEMHAIDEIAKNKNKIQNIALRINPDVDANTHEYITTGLSENKFGFDFKQLDDIITYLKQLDNINLVGIHFHIGSQIEDISVFQVLCQKINELQIYFEEKGFKLEHINLGGGLGIDYENPNTIPPFKEYFALFNKELKLRKGQTAHFELGRSIVGQCGSLISRVVHIKEGLTKKFVILDAGMTELIRPALYGAMHKIENISSSESVEIYDIVGPICESSDTFAKEYKLAKTDRKDLIVLHSAGAYGEVMAFQYNCRDLPKSYFSDTIK